MLAAQEEAQHFELEATYLTLTSRLALAAVQEAFFREQIKLAEASIDIARDVLTLLEKQLDANQSSRVDVATQEAALAQFEQQLQALSKQFGVNRDLMIALTGHLPARDCREIRLRLPSSAVRSPAQPSVVDRSEPARLARGRSEYACGNG